MLDGAASAPRRQTGIAGTDILGCHIIVSIFKIYDNDGKLIKLALSLH